MLLMDDMQLLRAYVTEGSEKAFETILNRHLNLVYSTALRQVRDPDLAGEVTQTTFIILARKAGSLSSGTVLAGWLYKTAQFAAARALRTEARRREREMEAARMQSEADDSIWDQLSPILDQAMADLGETDRNALVLRYFENKTAKDVGIALGINEAAAQKRLTRAIDKLRTFCTSKGVVLSAAGLTALLSANAVKAAPAGVAVATAAALKSGAVTASTSSLTSGTLKLMAWAKMKWAALMGLGVATAALGTAAFFQYEHASEPHYQHRPITSWLARLDNHDEFFSTQLHWTSWQADIQPTAAQLRAAEAIRAMGPKAVPYLIAALEKDDVSRWDKLLGRTDAVLAERHREAGLALEALGPACKPWVADFDRILHSGKCPKEAAIALAAMGQEGWQVLIRTSTEDGDPSVCAIWALGSHRVTMPGVEEALMDSYQRNHPVGNDIVALWALTEIMPDRQKLVPLLVEGLKSKRMDVQWGSAVLLGRIGPEARSAVPALQEMLTNTNPTVKHDAAQALQRIDPAAAAQAGVTGKLGPEHMHVPMTMLL